MKVERIDYNPECPPAAAEWDALLAESSRPTFFSSHDYVFTSLKHFKTTEKIFFLTMRDEQTDGLVAVFPMSEWIERKYGVRLVVLSHAVIPEASEIDKPYPLISTGREHACWEQFRDYFKTKARAWDLIDYDELISESYLCSNARALFAFPSFHVKTKAGPRSPIIDLSGDWEEFWGHHRKLRKKTRRLERALDERLRYEITSDPAEIERCLDDYIATEKISWKKGEMVARNAAFYRALMPQIAARGQLHFGVLRDGETVASMEVAYTYRDRVYFCHGTYAPDYAALSPGAVNSGWFIRHFHDKGFVEGDYLAGYADYVGAWASRFEETTDVVIRRMGWKNWYLAACHVLWKIKQRLAPKKRAPAAGVES